MNGRTLGILILLAALVLLGVYLWWGRLPGL
jgi:hypothetical protein